jgi:hypothetical protein
MESVETSGDCFPLDVPLLLEEHAEAFLFIHFRFTYRRFQFLRFYSGVTWDYQ